MRLLKKKTKDISQDRILELENELDKLSAEIDQLKNKQSTLDSMPISLIAEIEEIDFLLYSTNSAKFQILGDKVFVIPKLPENLDELKSFFHTDDISIFESSIEKSKEKPIIEIQIRLVWEKDGNKEIIPVEVTVFRNPSDKSQLIISIKDISELARQRKELVKSREKIEESDKLKSSILYNISHQIRTPLNSITGFAELLANVDSDFKKRREYIEIIKQQSKRILGLIDDISEIVKLETGRVSLTKIPCNLKLILKEILIGLNQQRTSKQQEQVGIKLNLPDGNGLEIMTDSGRLQQTLINIINYCLRYTQKGFIEFGYTFDEQASKLTFFINDTSNGLSKEEQKVIFNKFSVIDIGENTKMEDSGLGLTIAKNIIKNMNGKIWVESEEGKGNSFYFTIPFEPVPSTEHVDIESEISNEVNYQWPNKLILIVDDEEVNAMFLDAVFQGTGVQVLFAKNGLEAVELCKNINGINLILMDLKMPVMNGLKATQEIRKFNTKLPIIAQTALASEEDQHQCQLVGCNASITKPIEVHELMVLVNKFLCD
jgi:signal transduction histidine kinase